MLVEDGHILLELPLSARGWDRGELRREFDGLERDIERFSGLFSALSNAGRIRMMSAFFEELGRPLAFTELMNGLGMNPKLVWDSTRRLRQTGPPGPSGGRSQSPPTGSPAPSMLMCPSTSEPLRPT